MKFRTLALSLCACALAFAATTATTASAASGMQEIGLNAGVALPMGDFGKEVGSGYLVGATYCYHVNDMFGLGADVNYLGFGKKTDNGIDVTISGEQYGIHGKYFFPMKGSKEMPYIKVGVGEYSLSAKESGTDPGTGFTISETVTNTKTGFGIGLGSDWKMGAKSSWGIEAMYHTISTEGSSSNMITIAARYNWLMAGK